MQNASHLLSAKPTTSFEIYRIQEMERGLLPGSTAKQTQQLHQIIWITQGDGSFFSELKKIPVRNNLVFFVRPGQRSHIEPLTEVNGYVIRFAEAFITLEHQDFDMMYNPPLNHLFTQHCILMEQETLEDMKPVAERMLKEQKSENMFSSQLLKKYFYILLLYLTRHFENQITVIPQTRNVEIAEKFISLLEKQFRDNKKVADYARQMALKPNYLNEIVKNVTGYSAGYHIRQRIILEAKRLIFYSDTCRKEIAYYLGFTDTAHFSKFFKKVAGKNFTDFKKEKVIMTFTADAAV